MTTAVRWHFPKHFEQLGLPLPPVEFQTFDEFLEHPYVLGLLSGAAHQGLKWSFLVERKRPDHPLILRLRTPDGWTAHQLVIAYLDATDFPELPAFKPESSK